MSKTDKRKKTRSKSKPHTAIAAFLVKTYEILEDPEYNEIACWNKEGNAFVVKNVTEFSDKVLPKYFKHNNFASFVRQLNMYDFHKTRHENNENEFRHKLFKRGQKHLLADIKRKIADPHAAESNQLVPVSSGLDVEKFKKEANHFSTELKNMKGRQGELEKLSKTIYEQNTKLLKENKLLWGELIKNKDKYERKIEKLMMFVFSVMQQTGNSGNALEFMNNKKSIGPSDLSETLSDIGPDESVKGSMSDFENGSLPLSNDKKDHEKFLKNLGKYFQSKGNKSNLDKLMEVMKKGNTGNFSGLPTNFTEDKPEHKFTKALPSSEQNVDAPHHNTRSRRSENKRMKLPDTSDDLANDDSFEGGPSKFVKVEGLPKPVRNTRQHSNISNGFGMDTSIMDAPNLDQSFDLNRFDSIPGNKESPLLPPSMIQYNYQNPGSQDFLESPKPMLNMMKSDSLPPFRLLEEAPELAIPREDPMSLLSFTPANLNAKRGDSQGDMGYGFKNDNFEDNLGPFSPSSFLNNKEGGYNFGQ